MKTVDFFEVTKFPVSITSGAELTSLTTKKVLRLPSFDLIYKIGEVWRRKTTKKGKEKFTLLSPDEAEKVREQFKKKITYEDVEKSLQNKKVGCFVRVEDARFAASPHQFEKLLALNKLMNVAVYLNPKGEEASYQLRYSDKNGITVTDVRLVDNNGMPCFISKESTQQAIEILGEDVVKLALS